MGKGCSQSQIALSAFPLCRRSCPHPVRISPGRTNAPATTSPECDFRRPGSTLFGRVLFLSRHRKSCPTQSGRPLWPTLDLHAHLEVRVGGFSQGFVFPSGVFRFQTFMCLASRTAGIESGGLPLSIILAMSLRTQGRVVTGCPVPLTAVPSEASAVGKADRPGGCGLTTEESHEVGAEAAGLSMSFHTWVLYSSWVCLILDTG